MTTPLERAEHAVTEARQSMAFRLPVGQGLVNGRWMEGELDALVAAVEARYEARLREAANGPDVGDHARKAGHFLADVVAGWPTGSRVRFGPGEGIEAEESNVPTTCPGLDAPADACPLHSPTGVPCDCGHDGGADCHPNPNGATR